MMHGEREREKIEGKKEKEIGVATENCKFFCILHPNYRMILFVFVYLKIHFAF